MKNNNEILSILEAEFVRLIRAFNAFNHDSDYNRIYELMLLCNLMDIPFIWEWNLLDDGMNFITSITISGKRIEFD